MDSHIYICAQKKLENCAVNSGKLRVVAKIVRIHKFVKMALHNFDIFWWDCIIHHIIPP